MSELPIKHKSHKVRITRREQREEAQAFVLFPYYLDIHRRYIEFNGRFKHTIISWWHKAERMTGQLCENLKVYSSTDYIKNSRLNPITKKRNELLHRTAIKAKMWIEVRCAVDGIGI